MWIFKKLKKKEDDKMQFEKIAREWLEYKKTSIKESTYFNYMFIVSKYLLPEFKEKNIEEINNYNYFIQNLMQKLSNKSVRDIINVLKSILNYYEDEYNSVLQIKRINLPKVSKKKIKILSDNERKVLENYSLQDNSLKSVGIVVALNTGMRIGEICSLKWKNIDLSNKQIYVENTIQRVYDEENKTTDIIIDNPKTDSSIRSIPINTKLYKCLKKLENKFDREDYFLSGNNKKYVEPRNYQYYFKSILRKCELKPYKFHSLRHTFATHCIEVGMDAKSLSEILGHSDVKITLGIYVQSNDKIKQKFLEKL